MRIQEGIIKKLINIWPDQPIGVMNRPEILRRWFRFTNRNKLVNIAEPKANFCDITSRKFDLEKPVLQTLKTIIELNLNLARLKLDEKRIAFYNQYFVKLEELEFLDESSSVQVELDIHEYSML